MCVCISTISYASSASTHCRAQGLERLSPSQLHAGRHVTYSPPTNAPHQHHGVAWTAGNLPCWTTFLSSSKKTFNTWHGQWTANLRCNVRRFMLWKMHEKVIINTECGLGFIYIIQPWYYSTSLWWQSASNKINLFINVLLLFIVKI